MRKHDTLDTHAHLICRPSTVRQAAVAWRRRTLGGVAATPAQRRWIDKRAPPPWIEERRRTLAAAEVSVVEYNGKPYRLLRLPDMPVPPPDVPASRAPRVGFMQQIA